MFSVSRLILYDEISEATEFAIMASHLRFESEDDSAQLFHACMYLRSGIQYTRDDIESRSHFKTVDATTKELELEDDISVPATSLMRWQGRFVTCIYRRDQRHHGYYGTLSCGADQDRLCEKGIQ